MKIGKRYDAKRALEDLVEIAEGTPESGADYRKVLERIVRADTGFVMFGEPDVSGVNIVQLRNQLRAFLRSGLQPDQGQLMPTARVGLAATVAGRNKVLVAVDGRAHDVLWFQIMRLMQLEGLNRLRACDCGRVFLKTGRREFCSNRCQKRIYMRRFRAGETEKE